MKITGTIARLFAGLLVALLAGLLVAPLRSSEAADPRPPFTADRSLDFKPVGVKGHENCYVAEVGKGVMAVIMYAGDRLGSMELALTPEAYGPMDPKPEGFQFHPELSLYVKHFYAHETPHEQHMEHGGPAGHPPGHMK
ncbi:MAG: hypothetical protein HY725_14225 [Candidatus Rokubacteria bacterium]|nr:hypothetical protein [Candidatus Rokubacteria bacterium]